MKRLSRRFRTVRLVLETQRPVSFRMQCAHCGEHGGNEPTTDAALRWPVVHLEDHPQHAYYREHIVRCYRAEVVYTDARPR